MGHYRYSSRKRNKTNKVNPPLHLPNRVLTLYCIHHGDLMGDSQSNKSEIYEMYDSRRDRVLLKCYKCLEESIQEEKDEIILREELRLNIDNYKNLGIDSKIYENISSGLFIWGIFGSFIFYNFFTGYVAILNFIGSFGLASILFNRSNIYEKQFSAIQGKLFSVKNAQYIVESQKSLVREWHLKQLKIKNETITQSFAEIDKMTGIQFEVFIKNLLSKIGYGNPQITKPSGDEGADIITYKNDKKYAIQCKRYESNVSNSAVQQVFSAKHFYDCDEALVITNSSFTVQAKILANKLNVNLIDREELFDLMEKANGRETN